LLLLLFLFFKVKRQVGGAGGSHKSGLWRAENIECFMDASDWSRVMCYLQPKNLIGRWGPENRAHAQAIDWILCHFSHFMGCHFLAKREGKLILWSSGQKKVRWGGTACSHYQRARYFHNNNNDDDDDDDGLFTYLLSCSLALILLVTNNIY
jgi:hypothetical protein